MIAIWQWKFRLTVLIVAKCIVNEGRKEVEKKTNNVLIVAKCIVNITPSTFKSYPSLVLIVAKCIVNLKK